MEEEARIANKKKKQEKDEKWEKKRKIETPVYASLFNKQHHAFDLRDSAKTLVLNVVLVLAKSNTEKTILTPLFE